MDPVLACGHLGPPRGAEVPQSYPGCGGPTPHPPILTRVKSDPRSGPGMDQAGDASHRDVDRGLRRAGSAWGPSTGGQGRTCVVASAEAAKVIRDQVLVDRLRSGDEPTFVDPVRRWSPGMLRLGRRHVASNASAEDVVQEPPVCRPDPRDHRYLRCHPGFGTVPAGRGGAAGRLAELSPAGLTPGRGPPGLRTLGLDPAGRTHRSPRRAPGRSTGVPPRTNGPRTRRWAPPRGRRRRTERRSPRHPVRRRSRPGPP